LNKRGRLIVFSAPSGCGKSTVIKEILKRRPDFSYSISCTTRPIRNYEVDGVHYHFLTKEEFERRIYAGRFLEWAEVHDNFYGTDRIIMEEALVAGKKVLLDIDVIGGGELRVHFPDSILIFLMPPSTDELRRRLKLRGTDDEAAIERRLSRYPMELAKAQEYPYKIVNNDLEATISEVLRIIDNITNPQG
jgi:guanylate kinase